MVGRSARKRDKTFIIKVLKKRSLILCKEAKLTYEYERIVVELKEKKTEKICLNLIHVLRRDTQLLGQSVLGQSHFSLYKRTE